MKTDSVEIDGVAEWTAAGLGVTGIISGGGFALMGLMLLLTWLPGAAVSLTMHGWEPVQVQVTRAATAGCPGQRQRQGYVLEATYRWQGVTYTAWGERWWNGPREVPAGINEARVLLGGGLQRDRDCGAARLALLEGTVQVGHVDPEDPARLMLQRGPGWPGQAMWWLLRGGALILAGRSMIAAQHRLQRRRTIAPW